MPLKAAELHRLARDELGPVLESLRFKRTPKTSNASWVRAESERWLVMWFQPSRWNDSNSPGFTFTVEFGLGDAPSIGTGGPRRRLGTLLTDEEREELRQLENRTIAKLPPPDRPFALMLPAQTRDRWLSGWKPRLEPYKPDDDIWFRHGDEADARALMTFFKRALPGTIDRFLVWAAAAP